MAAVESTVSESSFARAGFLGNPSDGYFGKTISFAFDAFKATVELRESERILFEASPDNASYASPDEFRREIGLYGYYGGIRLLKATAKKFFDWCGTCGIAIPARNFTASFSSDIPRLVGLSGSSAICSAMLKALMRFYGVDISLDLAATLCLEAERDELGIACGLQDRVIQMYGGIVFMDFERGLVEKTGSGRYERLRLEKFPNLYIAWNPERAGESGKIHNNVRERFLRGESKVLAAMKGFAEIAQLGRDALVAGDTDALPGLVDANFDLRASIFEIAGEDEAMVRSARSCGASAKFAGSGGAIVGTFRDEDMFESLRRTLGSSGCEVVKPRIALQGCCQTLEEKP